MLSFKQQNKSLGKEVGCIRGFVKLTLHKALIFFMVFYREKLGKTGKIQWLSELWERKLFPFSMPWQSLSPQGLLIKVMKNVL